MANTTPTSIRIDSDLKRQAEAIFSELGLTTNSAITLFYKAVVREGGLPFQVRVDPTPRSSELTDVLARILASYGQEPESEDDASLGKQTQ